ncbi:histone H1 [Adhaeribacter rhizoryzae]|uniref:Histone H1 n=1 Tax=Adhaeribacter rhizoryzae TaxID=2607907 RepID=A0A5M6DKK2_9BACT|nr:histone H1 [Adhaeribacter rhizoryzae]KAA5547993.1 histone H1 [Adhaeribacter rhizoryzae]
MNQFSKVKDLVMSLEADFEKFYEKGNSAAGTRVRKGMQDLKNLAQELRKEVQDMKNNTANEDAAKASKAKK